MSLEAVTWVKNLPFESCKLGPYRVLVILAEHANSEGKRAFRSKIKIARTLDVTPRAVQNWFKELIKDGLIKPGDQSFVASIPTNRRPVVYDLSMGRDFHLQQVELPEILGENELSTGDSGENVAFAFGENAAFVSENQVLKPFNSSIKADHSARARPSASACPTHRDGHTVMSADGLTWSCCGLHPDQIFDPVSGTIAWREEAHA